MSAEDEIEYIENVFGEGKEYISRGDAVEASEKLYKVAEECIKLLAEEHSLPEYEEALREGRWWSKLLVRSARRLARNLNEKRIEEVWAVASDLHVWGFHERALHTEDVQQDIPYLEWLLNYTKGTRNKEK